MDAAFSALDSLPPQPGSTENQPEPAQPDPNPKPPEQKPDVKPAAPAKQPAKPAAPAKQPAAKPPEKPAEPDPSKPPEKPAEKKEDEQPKPGEKPPEEKPVEKPVEAMAPKELRSAYTALKNKVAELEKKAAQPPAPAKPSGPSPELEAAKKRETELRQQLEEHEQRLQLTNYEQSDEYRKKYHEPYMETARNAVSAAMEFNVMLTDGSSRPSTQEDFWEVASNPNAQEALKKAKELYGSDAAAAHIMGLRQQVRQQHQVGRRAIEEAKKNGAERMRQAQEQQKQYEQEIEGHFNSTLESLVEENPDLYKPTEGDEEGNKLLEAGEQEAVSAYTGQRNGKPMTPKELAEVNARVRAKAGAFDRVVHRNKALAQQVADLEAQIAEFHKSEPGATAPAPRQEQNVDGITSVENHFDKIARPGATPQFL